MKPIAPDDYEAESDFHSLQRAEEIKADKDRHGRAIAHGKKKMDAMKKVVRRGTRGQPPSGGYNRV